MSACDDGERLEAINRCGMKRGVSALKVKVVFLDWMIVEENVKVTEE